MLLLILWYLKYCKSIVRTGENEAYELLHYCLAKLLDENIILGIPNKKV